MTLPVSLLRPLFPFFGRAPVAASAPYRCPRTAISFPTFAAAYATLVVRPSVHLHPRNVRDNPGAMKKKRRLGRGEGSGRGKTSGRGHKGWTSTHGKSRPIPGYEGGQSGILSAIPKLGFRSSDKQYLNRLSLDTLQHWIETGRLDASKKIGIRELVQSRCLKKVRDGVVLLARGGEFLTHQVHLEVTKCSENAKMFIEKCGGRVECVTHEKTVLQALVSPEKFAVLPVEAALTDSSRGLPKDIRTQKVREFLLASSPKPTSL
ncbi:ribosomal protein L18e/L15P [Polychytrium aggregatum]|uniref:ribosomal protein L18e/L15P n=1 Tax=Polychytrium aggregatum TaxID=110093 RepID=UPI0022FEC099|nr:ribosomal protein L18e/L15P [Polychytrium aggregatum]KAI9209328.1 ribosomal protein L18e/L15P [Polychytrium aggregatum]